MGYVTKKELIDGLKSEGVFTSDELSFIEASISKDKISDEAILKLNIINVFEQKGILKRFYDFCDSRGYFPKWLDNVKGGLDRI